MIAPRPSTVAFRTTSRLYNLFTTPVRPMASSGIDQAANTGFKMLYMPLEGVEPLERYRPGGYHPVTIGDCLNTRYQIVHKLGFGTNSTTWLARDQRASTYVAVKISVAQNEQPESEILRLLNNEDSKQKRHPGKAIIPPLLDEFNLNGPNGEHKCVVTAPARVSVAGAQDASVNRLFQPSVARAIAAQLIQAVAFLHSLGIVHSGKLVLTLHCTTSANFVPDLHAGNILLCLPKSIDNLTVDEFYEKYRRPNPEPVERLDKKPLDNGVPTYGIMPVWLGEDSEKITVPEARILLTDFGESFMPSTTKRYHCNTPALLRPPELYFLPKEPVSFPADIWTLACTIFSILGQRPLFEAFIPDDDWMIQEHVDTLGKLPPDWWSRWESRGKWFDEQGERRDGQSRRPWEERFEYSVQEPRRDCGMEGVSEQEKVALIALLRPMMAYDPKERPTAKEILESEWMNKWALQDLGDMQRQ